MAKSDTFGWDLLYKVTEPQIRNNQDVLICLTHWKLIHQGFRCVGVGEDVTPPNLDEQSELLPEGWNATTNKYALRYVHNHKLYLFNAIVNDSKIIINMNRVVDNQATGTCIDIDVVKGKQGLLAKVIPNYEEIISTIHKQLIQPMLAAAPNKEVETQTPKETSSPLRVDSNRSESYPYFRPQPIPHPGSSLLNDPLRNVGRADLDPFAPGGGMLFEPHSIGPRAGPRIDPSLPPGAVPPGARFDPFRPLPRGNMPPRGNPDHDHLPPPGYDDMFM